MGAIFASFLRVGKRKRLHQGGTTTLPTNRDRQLAFADESVVDFTVTDKLFRGDRVNSSPHPIDVVPYQL
eukprot:66211-Rhodomonas_salina.1